YLARETHDEEVWSECWRVLVAVLEAASEPLTQRQMLSHWPEDARTPDIGTISRGLKRGLDQGLMQREGTGRKNDQYRYWLVESPADGAAGLAAPVEKAESQPVAVGAEPVASSEVTLLPPVAAVEPIRPAAVKQPV